ncbi:MAG: hypothetical protein WCG34_02960 [Leptolinea sp.]
MTKKSISMLLAVSALGLGLLACSLVGNSSKTATIVPKSEEAANPAETNQPGDAAAESENSNSNSSNPKSDFPFPADTKIIQSSPEMLIGTVKMPLGDVVSFYRKEIKQQGLSEDTQLTAITDTSFSLVFKGTASGKSLVAQGTDMGDGSISFSVRYE